MDRREKAGADMERMVRGVAHPEETRSQEQRAAEHLERTMADHAEERRLQREERGETLTLVQELLEAAQSTSVAGLRWRRIWAILERRRDEITFSLLERGDGPALWMNAYARGERWDEAAQAWLPKAAPGVPNVTLRRLDCAEPFTFKTAPRDMSLAESKAVAKAWSAAPEAERGPDPQGIYRKVTPAADGTFTLPFGEAQKCWRQHRDSHIRARNRKLGNERDRPIVAELAPAAQWVPPLVLGGAA